MITLKELPYMTLTRQTVSIIPKSKNRLFDNIYFLNIKNLKSFEGIVNHKNLKNTRYVYYYYPFKYKGKVITKAYNLNLRNRRKADYRQVSNFSSVKTIENSYMIKNRNLFMDLRICNEIFFARAKDRHYDIILTHYISYLKEIMSSYDYKNKYMIIDLEDWKVSLVDFKDRRDSILNPVYMIYYLLKKKFTQIRRLGDIDLVFISHDRMFKMNTLAVDKTTFSQFRTLINRISKNYLPGEKDSERMIEELNLKNSLVQAIKGRNKDILNKKSTVPKRNEDKRTAGDKIADAIIAMEGKIEYTQNVYPNEGKLSSPKGKSHTRFEVAEGYGDCITVVSYVFKTALNIDIGESIDELLTRGIDVPFNERNLTKNLKTGDVIIFKNDNGTDHAEVHVGEGMVYGHGSVKRKGPRPRDLADFKSKVYNIKRYTDDKGQPLNCPIVDETEIRNLLSSKKLNFTGEDDDYQEFDEEEVKVIYKDKDDDEITDKDEVSEDIEEDISSEVEEVIDDKLNELSEEEILDTEEALESLSNDKEFIADIYEKNKNLDESRLSPRDKKLREEFRKIRVQNENISDIYVKAREVSAKKFESRKIEKKLVTINKNVENVRYPDFDKKYITEVMKKDYIDAFKSLTEKSIRMQIISIKTRDSSNELNYKETWTVVLEDEFRLRHTITVDVPLIIDNRFFWLDGNKKVLYKQKFPLPVIKVGPNKVQICGNYNKVFLNRYGQRVTASIEKFNFAIFNNTSNLKIHRGNNRANNERYVTTFEYDEISSKISRLESKDMVLYFNIPEMIKEKPEFEEIIYRSNNDSLPIGYFKKTPNKAIILDVDKQTIIDNESENDLGLIDFIMANMDEKVNSIYDDAKTGTKFIHSRVDVMKKHIPLIIMLGFSESLSGVLRKAGIKHRFSDKKPSDITNKERVIRFNDGYFIYETPKFSAELLMNGLTVVNTRTFNFTDFDTRDTYIDIFQSLYGSRILGNALDNFYESLIDPKTREILEYINQPTDFTSVFLYANELLSDNNHLPEDDMSQFRIRSFEMLPGMLYKGLAQAYAAYKSTYKNNNPTKISLPQDYLIKQVLALTILENYSDINPLAELEKNRDISPKGHSGLNLDRAYTLDKRTYHPSMKGIYSIITATDRNTGVRRTLSLEPNINNIYGMVDLKTDDEINDVNLFSPAEMATPLGSNKDDSSRTCMAVGQAKHAIPTDKASPVIVSNGFEEVLPYYLGKDFTIVAEEDGQIVEVREDIIIAKYKSGKIQAIDLRGRTAKNSGGGFFLNRHYVCDMKKGQRFNKDDILAYDSKFFSKSDLFGVRLNIGCFQKIAIMPTDMTIEDSCEITKNMSKDMMSEITVRIPVVLKKTTNVDYIVKKGQKVHTGEEILKFDVATSDADISQFLTHVGDDMKEEILTLSKNKVKSKVTGIIADVKMYTTVELNELTPSLQKIFNLYNREIKSFTGTIDKYLTKEEKESPYRGGIYISDKVGKISPNSKGKVKGEEIGEGVLIEIYVTYFDYMGIGDKGSFFTALKFEVSSIIPEGYEPYTPDRPDEEISIGLGPSAIISRKTPSIQITMAANKGAVELKRKLWEIYYGKKWNDRK